MHTIDYILKLKDAKFSDEQITAIATILSDIEEKQKNESATKKDIELVKFELQRDIEKSKNQTIVWVFGMLVLFSGSIIGVISKGFHWF